MAHAGETARRAAVAAGFGAYLLLGLAIVDDYGVSWDEPINRTHGERTFRYVAARLSGDATPAEVLFEGDIAEQGPAFELALHALERASGGQDLGELLRLRHRATFVVFWAGTIAFYALLRLRFGSRGLAATGVLLLVLCPRTFSHSFYDSKDTILLACFAAAMATLPRSLRRPTPANAALHALACAVAIDVRLAGLALPAVTFLLLALRSLRARREEGALRRNAAFAATYLALLVALVILLWPQLWENPVAGFAGALAKLSVPAQRAHPMALYRGEFVRVDALPWHYLPVWIGISLPIGTLLLSAAGAGIAAWSAWRRVDPEENEANAVALALVFGPIAAAIASGQTLYDGWRHFFFVTPALVMLALLPIREGWRRPRWRVPVAAAAGLLLVHAGASIARLHPYQHVYFNALAGRAPWERFELDYWGLSYREGLAHLLHAQPTGTLRVHVSDVPGVVNAWLLAPADRARLEFVGLEKADWFVSNHRQPALFHRFQAGLTPFANEVYAVEAGGAKLLGVYDLR